MDYTSYFKVMVDKDASDMFFSVGARVSVKVEGSMVPITPEPLKPGEVKDIAYGLMSEVQMLEFEKNLEMNFGTSIRGVGRFRINVYNQRGQVSMVARYVKTNVPSIDELGLPQILKELILEPRGLILVAGATGVGKSTSMAAMIDYRNAETMSHILTIEDPIEYMHGNRKSIVDQREVGIDTHSFNNALVNAMREAPDVILIGEIRDHDSMQQAISFSDTGHLCLSTIHANNADQTMDRILNFFPKDVRQHVLMDLSLNLKAVIAQRLVMGLDGKRLPAVEILLNTPFISDLIQKGEINEIKKAMSDGKDPNVRTFDQALFRLFKANKISKEEAIKHADSKNDLTLKMRFSGDDQFGTI